MMYVLAFGGFVLLFAGGELLVRGAVAVSRCLGLSPLLIGMTVVAWCTSSPELVVSIGAALRGSSDIALGNVIGSNIFNVLGVLGTSAVIAPIVVKPQALRRDTLVMLFAAAALGAMALTGEIGRIAGAALLGVLAVYVVRSYRTELKDETAPSAELHTHEASELGCPTSIGQGIAYLLGGLVALVVGSQLLVSGATDIARTFGVSEAIIGLTLVAVGTSLPELATSIMAAIRGHSDVAVGNVIGSNTFNILGIIGVTSLVRPIAVAPQMATTDVWVALGVAAVAALLLLWRGRISRLAGAALLTGYVGYVVTLFVA
jgi:cation:H+ antiporter